MKSISLRGKSISFWADLKNQYFFKQLIMHLFMESIQFNLTTVYDTSACIYHVLKRYDLHINTWFFHFKSNLFQSNSWITFQNSLLHSSTFTQDFLCILSHHSNLEQSITFLSCELLSLEGKINYIDKSLKVILVLQISLFKTLVVSTSYFQDCWK